jgi:flagellar basal-body rod protein FlgF
MGQAIYRAVSGSMAQMRRLDVLANNLAHSDTAGFKADRVRFQEVLDAEGRRTRFVDTPVAQVDLTQGSLKRTDNPLDVAILGKGFFVVDTPDGQQLTRSGRFAVGTDGNLRTIDGHMVLGEAGPMAVPPPGTGGTGNITIDATGELQMGGLQLGRLKRVQANSDQLRKVEGQRFEVTDGMASLTEPPTGEVLQGHVEESNVNPVVSMTRMISVQRTTEALNQAIRVYREIDSQSTKRMA